MSIHNVRKEVMLTLEQSMQSFVDKFLIPAEKIWQPTDFLPNSQKDSFITEVEEIRELSKELHDDFWVVLVGDTITEEALPTYESWLLDVDGISSRNSRGTKDNGWAKWIRSWTAEENRHGDVLNKYLYLSGRVNMKEIEKTTQYLIADGFDSFLAMMPEIADIRVAVMLGHGSTSSRNGKLYQRGSESLILDNQIHTVDEIKTNLRTKMYNPHTDHSTDGGEAGLHSLNSSLKDDRFIEIQNQGFYRDDAALVVIFVADEQDICAQFPQGVTPVPDPQGKEDSSRIRDCTDGNGNQILDSQVVLNNLKAKIGDKPLVVGGVLYNNLNTTCNWVI